MRLFLLSPLLIATLFLGCSTDEIGEIAAPDDRGDEAPTLDKRTVYVPAKMEDGVVYPIDTYAMMHNNMVDYGLSQEYTYQEFWDEAPAIFQDIIDRFYDDPAFNGDDIALGFADVEGGPNHWVGLSPTELVSHTKATWHQTGVVEHLSASTITELETILDFAANGGNPITMLEQLRLDVQGSSSELERNLVGNALGSAHYWYSDLNKGPYDDVLVGFGIDCAVGAMASWLGPKAASIIGTMASLQYALALVDMDAPEVTWGGIGHWGLHH